MEIKQRTEHVGSFKALRKLLSGIEKGDVEKPDWIEFDGEARLNRLDPKELEELLARIHGAVLRGFEANNLKRGGKKAYLDYWCRVASHGFHDFADDCWMKCYDSPHVESYDYITPYLQDGLDALDPYMVYSSVLGTWEYSVEDFVHTDLCQDVQTVVEPLAGSAEFCYAGHFFYPDMRYVMFDLDQKAKEHVERQFWHPQTRKEFFVADALEESTWKRVRELSEGKSLSYIGKQSQNFFDPKQLFQLLQWGTTYTDYFMLEVSEPYLIEDEPTMDELTRREQKAAGFRCALDDDEPANPLTNHMDFRLITWDKSGTRTLFEYLRWIGWQAPTLYALGEILDLDVLYFHSEDTEFLPLLEGTDTSDCRENNTFLMFKRRG